MTDIDNTENPDDIDPIDADDRNNQAPVEEAPEEYGDIYDYDPPGVDAPPDLEDQNVGDDDA